MPLDVRGIPEKELSAHVSDPEAYAQEMAVLENFTRLLGAILRSLASMRVRVRLLAGNDSQNHEQIEWLKREIGRQRVAQGRVEKLIHDWRSEYDAEVNGALNWK